jgi:tetratricopeptide (TPR) repeat protein
MLVTLPFCLLLLDYWPLRRAERGPSRQERKRKKASRPPVASTAWLIAEKIPFFALSAAVSVATFFFQKQAGAMDASEAVPVAARVANAFWAYAHYIAATFWPSGLAVLYPHQGADFPLWKGIASLALLGTISAAAVVFRRRAPYCSVGWFWFLGTLVPVIGFVQVGTQAYADRYTYVPHIGLFIAMVWGIPEFVGHRLPAGSFAPVAASILIILGIVTWAQLPHWKNSVSLFTRAVAVTENNYTAHGNLGNALADNRRLDEAVRHYREAVRIRPTYADAYNNWATISIGQGRLDDAASQLRAALRIKPAYAEAHSNMGMVLQAQGHSDEAISEFLEALRLKPDYFQAHNNAAAVLASLGRSEDAVMHYREALRLVPDYTKARSSLGLLFLQLGRLDEAETEFRELLARNPNHADGRATLERIITLKNAKQ